MVKSRNGVRTIKGAIYQNNPHTEYKLVILKVGPRTITYQLHSPYTGNRKVTVGLDEFVKAVSICWTLVSIPKKVRRV